MRSSVMFPPVPLPGDPSPGQSRWIGEEATFRVAALGEIFVVIVRSCYLRMVNNHTPQSVMRRSMRLRKHAQQVHAGDDADRESLIVGDDDPVDAFLEH